MKGESSICYLYFYTLGLLLANFLIVMTIRYSQTLGSPSMYFFLFYLSFVDACLSTTTAPRLIVDSVSEKKIISYNECMTQIFAFHFFGAWGSWYLSSCPSIAMWPFASSLRYTAIMSQRVCGALVRLAWWGSGIHSSAQILLGFEITVAPMLLITTWWICNLAETCLCGYCGHQPTSQCLTVGPYAWRVSCCCLSPMVSSYILWVTVAQKEEGKPFPHAPPTLLLLSYSLYHVYTYMSLPLTVFPVDKMVAVFYTILTPLLNLWFMLWGMQKSNRPWESYGATVWIWAWDGKMPTANSVRV